MSTPFAIVDSGLVEATSIALGQSICQAAIATSLQADAIATTFVCQGQGNLPVLLLHGFDSSVLEFRRLLPLLTEHHQTWAVDLLGFGFTERPRGLPITPTTIKTHLYGVWQALIQRPVVLVGASMGGATAIDFALSYPQAVAQLVLIDSAGYTRTATKGKWLVPPLTTLATAFLRNAWVRQQISRQAYFDPRWASADAQCCAALHLQCARWAEALISFTQSGGYGSFKAQLSQIRCPTLILWGSCDRILGTQDAAKFHQAIPGSQLVWIPDCGHVPHLEQPQETAKHILDAGRALT